MAAAKKEEEKKLVAAKKQLEKRPATKRKPSWLANEADYPNKSARSSMFDVFR